MKTQHKIEELLRGRSGASPPAAVRLLGTSDRRRMLSANREHRRDIIDLIPRMIDSGS